MCVLKIKAFFLRCKTKKKKSVGANKLSLFQTENKNFKSDLCIVKMVDKNFTNESNIKTH